MFKSQFGFFRSSTHRGRADTLWQLSWEFLPCWLYWTTLVRQIEHLQLQTPFYHLAIQNTAFGFTWALIPTCLGLPQTQRLGICEADLRLWCIWTVAGIKSGNRPFLRIPTPKKPYIPILLVLPSTLQTGRHDVSSCVTGQETGTLQRAQFV